MTEAIVVTPVSNRGNGRAAKIGVIGLVIVLALFVLPKVLGGGGGSGSSQFDTVQGSTTPAAVAPGEGSHDAPESSLGVSSKNPFRPLYATDAGAPSTAPAEAPPAVVDPALAVPVASAPAADTSGSPPADNAVAAPTPATAPHSPARFGLVQVGTAADGTPFASVRVDGGVFQAVVGQEFGGYYKVAALDVAKRCGDFLYGDQRFSLCEGEETTT